MEVQSGFGGGLAKLGFSVRGKHGISKAHPTDAQWIPRALSLMGYSILSAEWL